MKRLIRILISACFALASMNAHSQQFPEGASTPTAPDVKKYLDDKVFSVKLADGNSWRLEYKSNGYFLREHQHWLQRQRAMASRGRKALWSAARRRSELQ